MTSLATQSGFDAEADLAREGRQPAKYNYLAGEVLSGVSAKRKHGDCRFPSAGVSNPFDGIVVNLGPDDSALGGEP